MEGVANRGALVGAALGARDEADALGKVQMARMFAHYHESVGPLREFIDAGHLSLALARDGTLVLALPFDLLTWNSDSERVFTALASFAREKGLESRTVLLNGIATPRLVAALRERGFAVRPRFLFRG